MHKYFFFFLAALAFQGNKADGQVNLVPNPSFEILSAKPKKIGEIDKATPWISPTSGTAEIFWLGSKSEDLKVPNSSIGFQHPRSGNNYAGMILYDKKNPNLREYIQVELTDGLEKGKVYCVEFYVSIADLSKHSIDLVGAHLSKKKVTANNMEPINVVPHVQNKQGKQLNNQIDWEIICGEYKAKGGEKFLTIGNFNDDSKLQVGKMKKPKNVTGSQNEYGYYFIDDVSVILQDNDYKCDCLRKIQGTTAPMKFIYSKVSGENEEELNPKEAIESKRIYFEEGKAAIAPGFLTDIGLIVKYLSENPGLELQVIGYADERELKANSLLNEERAQMVIDLLEKQGIRADRIKLVKKSSSGQASAKEIEKGLFRRVDFQLNIKE
jgi:OmpA-OmpF porin, OOP family